MANRYDNGSVAKFNPFSYQELAVTPMMMRQKHDASIAQAEAMRIKADPLDVHLNKAVGLKRQMDDEIAKNVDTLNREGYNPTTFQNINKLNRQYQDLVSPTGEVGQINAAKQVYAKEKEAFLKSASDEKIGKDRAELLWKAKTANYTGFDEDGNKITTVTPQGVAAFQDYDKEKQIAHSLLGKTVQGLSSSGHHLEQDGTGGFWEVTQNGERIKSNNTQQIELAKAAFKQSWLRGEGAKYVKDAGLNINEQRIDNDFNSMLELSDVKKSSESANYNTPPKPVKGEGDGISDIGGFEKIPYGIENTSVSTDIADKINRIGGKSAGKALSYSYDVLTGKKPQAQSKGEFDKARSQVFIKPEDVLQGGELSIYNNAKKQVSNSVPGFNKLSVTEQNKLIANKASKDILTFSPIVIKPTVKSVGALIPGVQKGADIKSIGNSMLDDAIGGARVLYDVETGEPISKEDVKETVKGMSLYGVTAPHNLRNQKMIGATVNQKVSPIIATITDSDGKKRQVYVSRTSTELKSPEFAKIKSANDVFNGVVNNMNTQVRVTDKNSNIYGSKVKYDSSITDGYPIIITLPNGTAERISLDEFQNDAL
jgi:hypothetical protein